MSFTIGEVIGDVIRREGPKSDRKNDRGGRTQFGIAEKSNPEAWKDGKVTAEEARDIYLTKYVKAPGFDKVTDPKLQAQLVDFGVNSGPAVAITKLQHVLGVTEDGMLGPQTLAALQGRDLRAVNNLLLVERVLLIGRIIHNDPRQVVNINGWLGRATEFLL